MAGCGSAEEAGTTLPAASAAPSSTAPITTTTAVYVETIAPVETTSPPTTVSPTTWPEPGEPWDLLYFGFDDLFTRESAELYVELASAAAGVEIRTTHPSGWEHLYVSNQLPFLRNERFPELGEAARSAEMIVLLSRPSPADDGPMAVIYDDFMRCGWEAGLGLEPSERSDDYWQVFRNQVDEVYEELWNLRDGMPTILLAIDMYAALPQEVYDFGNDAACLEWWSEWSEQLRQAAEAHGGTMVSLFDAFNGLDRSINPVAEGLVGPTPEYRANAAGIELIASTLAAAGLERSQP